MPPGPFWIFHRPLKLLGDLVKPLAKFRHLGLKLQDCLDSGQVDAEVALKGQDGPEAADLGRCVALDVSLPLDVDQASPLIT